MDIINQLLNLDRIKISPDISRKYITWNWSSGYVQRIVLGHSFNVESNINYVIEDSPNKNTISHVFSDYRNNICLLFIECNSLYLIHTGKIVKIFDNYKDHKDEIILFTNSLELLVKDCGLYEYYIDRCNPEQYFEYLSDSKKLYYTPLNDILYSNRYLINPESIDVIDKLSKIDFKSTNTLEVFSGIYLQFGIHNQDYVSLENSDVIILPSKYIDLIKDAISQYNLALQNPFIYYDNLIQHFILKKRYS